MANIYAAGDCSTAAPRLGERVWHPLGQPAVRQGWVAGANAAGAGAASEARHAGIVGTNVVKVFRLEVARTGLSLAEAQNHGFDAVSVESETGSRAGYYPSGTKILTRIVAARSAACLAHSGGREGAAQRIECTPRASLALSRRHGAFLILPLLLPTRDHRSDPARRLRS